MSKLISITQEMLATFEKGKVVDQYGMYNNVIFNCIDGDNVIINDQDGNEKKISVRLFCKYGKMVSNEPKKPSVKKPKSAKEKMVAVTAEMLATFEKGQIINRYSFFTDVVFDRIENDKVVLIDSKGTEKKDPVWLFLKYAQLKAN